MSNKNRFKGIEEQVQPKDHLFLKIKKKKLLIKVLGMMAS